MKNGKTTELDRKVSETIFHICKIERARYDAYVARGNIHYARKELWDIPGLPREQRDAWQRKLLEIDGTLGVFIDLLTKQANRLEYENITRLEISAPKKEEEE